MLKYLSTNYQMNNSELGKINKIFLEEIQNLFAEYMISLQNKYSKRT